LSNIPIQKNVVINERLYLLKSAVACPLSGPADGGKPKWATFMALPQWPEILAFAGNQV
jgi:hypothetical protein